MEMCPYCGEEVPDESAKCWKCGAVLQDVDEETMEKLADDHSPGPKLVPCPHCNSPQAPNTHRCKECGRVINDFDEVEPDKWKYGTWIAFGGVGLLIVLILAVAILTREPDRQRQYSGISYKVLAQRYSAVRLKSKKAEAADEWDKKYGQNCVKWRGTVVKIDGNLVDFAMSEEAKKAKKAEVRVEFLDEADAFVASLAVGKTVSYDAKLLDYNQEGVRFILEWGQAVEAEKKSSPP